MSSARSSVTSAPVRLTGRVKWFNNKTGFGFISVVGGNDQFKDASEIFVHHSAVTVSQEQYRYLVEGEYVEFNVVTTESSDHKFQAGDVRGVKGGKLFCETRHEHRASQDSGSGGEKSQRGERSERGRHQVRGRGGYSSGGRGGHVNTDTRGAGYGGRGGGGGGGGGGGSEWMLVRRDRVENTESRGRGGDYSGRPSRPERYDRGMERSVSSAPQSHPQPQSQPQSKPQAKASPAAPVDSENSVPETPRAVSTKKPRQAKLSA